MPSHTDTSTKISNRDISVPSVCDCCELTSHFPKYFHHNKLHGDCSVAVVCDYRGPTSYLHATYSDGSIFHHQGVYINVYQEHGACAQRTRKRASSHVQIR